MVLICAATRLWRVFGFQTPGPFPNNPARRCEADMFRKRDVHGATIRLT
jgi:hypothetical protein